MLFAFLRLMQAPHHNQTTLRSAEVHCNVCRCLTNVVRNLRNRLMMRKCGGLAALADQLNGGHADKELVQVSLLNTL